MSTLSIYPGPHKTYLKFDGRKYVVHCDCGMQSEPIHRHVDALMRSIAHKTVENRRTQRQKR